MAIKPLEAGPKTSNGTTRLTALKRVFQLGQKVRLRTAAAGAILLLVAVAGLSVHARSKVSIPTIPIQLTSEVLTDPSGEARRVDEWFPAEFSVLFVVGLDDCINCANYPWEIRELHNLNIPAGLIISSAPEDQALRLIRQVRASEWSFLDGEGALAQAVRHDPPFVLWLSRKAKVIAIDDRPPADYRDYPTLMILRSISGRMGGESTDPTYVPTNPEGKI